MITTLKEAQKYLESFIRPTVFELVKENSHLKNPLDRMRVLLELLGNPQQRFKSVQVSGTSGKGSTSYLLANILTKAGYKTGFVTSPHLQRITERMQINMEEIPDHDLIELVGQLIPVNEQMKNLPVGEPSYFELLTALAFMHFAEQRVDISVVEVGLEGKYDATNVLDPLIVVLTNISKDHTDLLGETEEKIASEAYSIVRKNASGKPPIVITGITSKTLLDQLSLQANRAGAQLKILHRDFDFTIKKHTDTGVLFDFSTNDFLLQDIELMLRGDYQVANASLSLAAVTELEPMGFPVSINAIKQGLAKGFFPGRFEVRSYMNHTLILDGAHNQAKMAAFLEALNSYYPHYSKQFIVGFKQNKQVEPMIASLFSEKDAAYIFTVFHNSGDYARSSSMNLEALQLHVEKCRIKHDYRFSTTAFDALREALTTKADLIVVTGSLYLVGEMRDILEKETTEGE